MIVHSKDKKQQTTKLDRIGVCAKTRKDIVFNNLAHVVDLDLLYQSYLQLDERKAKGCDGVTKEAYGEGLGENLKDLLARIRRGAYKPKPARIGEIPKEDGSKRPLAISCFEDKIVQQAVNTILTKVFEPQFLPCSYGYREGMNCHEALRTLMKYNYQTLDGAVVEIDLKKYFNTIPHGELMTILKEKISDKRFLGLIEKLIRTPILEKDGKAVINTVGCPQGSIISPVLSNVYLHHVIDQWFDTIRRTHLKGRAEEVRFADDMVFVFQYREDAERFYRVLPKRLQKFALTLHMEKSSIIRAGRKAAEEAAKKNERLPSYKFLGFTCYWGKSLKGCWRFKYKSRSDRTTAKLKGLRKYLRENLNQNTVLVINRVIQVVKGWMSDHAISDNQSLVRSFLQTCRRILYRWINRKGRKVKMNWENFTLQLKRLKFPESFKVTSMFSQTVK
jgi:group II intron reverse transcriptase/maturase